MKKSNGVNRHMRIAEAAKMIGMSGSWLRQKIKSGEIQGCKLARALLVNVDSLNAYMEARCTTQEAA